MTTKRGAQANQFFRAYEGATRFRMSLQDMMDQIESITDYLRMLGSMSSNAQRLNRQLWITMEELHGLERMVAGAETDMNANVPLVEDESTPEEVLKAEGVFRDNWMAYGAVEVTDE